MDIIKLEHVTKKIGRRVILSDINLSVKKGIVLGISGPNGSGKSMLFNTIIGFVKPNEGTVIVNKKKIREDVYFSEDISFSMDNVGILDNFSAKKNLELIYLLNHKGNYSSIINEKLYYVGLDPNDGRKVKNYSLGMKKRLSIAAALLNDSPILILDEPSNALDDSGKDFLKTMIYELKKKGTTILISNHDKDFLNSVCDEIVKINEGKLQ